MPSMVGHTFKPSHQEAEAGGPLGEARRVYTVSAKTVRVK